MACIGVGYLTVIRRKLQLQRRIEMPERKADQNIEDWLREGLVALESSRAVGETNCNEVASPTVLTAEDTSLGKRFDPRIESETTAATCTDVAVSTSEVAAQCASPAKAEVAAEGRCPAGQRAANEEDAEEWFWNLLAQLGYERW